MIVIILPIRLEADLGEHTNPHTMPHLCAVEGAVASHHKEMHRRWMRDIFGHHRRPKLLSAMVFG